MNFQVPTSRWVLLFVLVVTSRNALAFESINFNADFKSEVVTMPVENCTSMIDDESNYEVVQTARNRFKVSTKAINENSAMLLIDCTGQTFAFGLNFKNQPTDNFDSKLYQEAALRPPSFLGSSYNSSPLGKKTLNLELFDGSYEASQISVARDYSDTQNMRDHRDSLDLFHHFDRVDFGYGVSRGYTDVEIVDEFRERLRVMNMSGTASETIVNKAIVARRYFLLTPPPVSVTYSYNLLRTGDIVHEADRSFFTGVGAATIYSRIGFSQSISQGADQRVNRWEGSNNTHYKYNAVLGPGFDTSTFCLESAGCRFSSFSLLNESRFSSSAIDLKYGIFPHIVALRFSQFVYGKDEATLNINRSLKPQPWTEQRSWIDASTTADNTHSNATVHLEYRHKEYYYFLDHDVLIIDPALEESQRVMARSGIRFEGRTWAYGASIDFPYQKRNCCGFAADFHWYFDRNIRYVVLSSARHQLLGKVVSDLTEEPIEDAEVVLMEHGETIRQTTTSKAGLFEFSSIPKSGSFTIVVKKGSSMLKKEIEKDLTKLTFETNLRLQDYYLIEVRFYNQDRPGSQIQNYARETNDAIVSAPDAIYIDNKIYVKKGKPVTLKLSPEFLPYDVELLEFKGQNQITTSEEDGNVEIRLRSKHP